MKPSRVLYLHGFASSAGSTKAGYFAERLRAHGVALDCPDFNQPDFATLTVTRMLDQLGSELARDKPDRGSAPDPGSVARGAPDAPLRSLAGAPCAPRTAIRRSQPEQNSHEAPYSGPVALIGSSLGGTLAILAAARFAAKIERIVLLAPAVMFAKAGHHLLPPERVDEWRRRGALPFFHYAYDEDRLLSFSFYEDSLRYDAFQAVIEQPAIIFQGLRDASVDYRTVEAFARTRPNITLSLLDDDHQLIASLPRIWEGVEHFLGLTE